MTLVVAGTPVTTKDGSKTLFSTKFQQTYHSVHGASTEANHVFLNTSGAKNRLCARLSTRIFEIGLGPGLNFLLTADLAVQQSTQLDYWAVENTLFSRAQIDALGYDSLLEHTHLPTLVHQVYEQPARLAEAETDGVRLHLHKQDLQSLALPHGSFDIIYLDAFSPEYNPECWSEPMLQGYFRALTPGGTLSTYCVRGAVRRALINVGFRVRKCPGPPGKREILVASKPHASP